VPVFDLIGKRRWFYLFSALITVPGFIFIVLTLATGGAVGLKFSVDFTGGTVIEVHFASAQQPTPAEVRAVLTEQNLDGTVAITQSGDTQYVLIRTEALGLIEQPAPTPSPPATASPSPSASPSPTSSPSPSPAPTGSAAASGSPGPTPTPSATPSPSPSPSPTPTASPSPSPSPSPTPAQVLPTSGKLGDLAAALVAKFGPIDEVRQEATIGPLISAELGQQAILLVILGSIGILAWMTFRFADFRMGMTALVALLHDVIVVVGTFAILGTLIGLEVDALFVTAMLTVIGFSVHDTIVVYDRIRENRIRHAGEPFEAIVNHSLLQTIGRSLNTSLTTILVLTALLLFGSDAIRAFVFAMVLGILSGTYSSIFNASALLVDWHLWDERRRAREVAAGAR
jgi:preprotein translocase SecF subunit